MADFKDANTMQLRTTISPQLNSALDQMVVASGVAKTTLVRQAIATVLAGAGAVSPGTVEAIPVTRSADCRSLLPMTPASQ